jgi:hypothetical protein
MTIQGDQARTFSSRNTHCRHGTTKVSSIFNEFGPATYFSPKSLCVSILSDRIASLRDLLSHFRFHLTLRSQEGHYHSLILFRLASTTEVESSTLGNETQKHTTQTSLTTADATPSGTGLDRQIYVMEANCPHLGADMSHAEIEECDTGVVAVCPWHRSVVISSGLVQKLNRKSADMILISKPEKVKQDSKPAPILLK